jgi:hypothetical protein
MMNSLDDLDEELYDRPFCFATETERPLSAALILFREGVSQ